MNVKRVLEMIEEDLAYWKSEGSWNALKRLRERIRNEKRKDNANDA